MPSSNLPTSDDFAQSNQPFKLLPSNRKYVREYLQNRFDLGELEKLLFDLGLDYQNFSHSTKDSFVMDLIAYSERVGRNMVLQLLECAQAERSDATIETICRDLANPEVGQAPTVTTASTPTTQPPKQPNSKQPRIFLSYKRNTEMDEQLAHTIYQSLSESYQIFIDKTMLVGTMWAERVEQELREADFMIVLLSAQSIQSEMLTAEVATAYQLWKTQGHPLILPIRLNYTEPFQYPLSAYLNSINWTVWQDPANTPALLNELRQAIENKAMLQAPPATLFPTSSQTAASLAATESFSNPQPSAQPRVLEMPEGTMDTESKFYIERSSDKVGLAAINSQGVTITIKGPRQMGKSSLLIRIKEAASRAGKRVAFLDFQLFDKAALTDADTFYQQFCLWLSDELELDSRVEEFWKTPLSNSMRCTRYMQRYLLKELNCSIVLAMDEVETIFDTNFRSDFFAMLRTWHNSRQPGTVWKQLDLALVTSTEPYQLIENLNQSPFNVGEVIELSDFTLAQVQDLANRHSLALNLVELNQLFNLLNGHPFLTRRALYLLASQRLSSNDLFATATEDRGPFGDHLRHHLFRIYNQPALVQGLQQVLRSNNLSNEEVFFRLRGAGLVRREGKQVVARCQLYERYFKEHLNG